MATGDFHSCAVGHGGVQCWGYNGLGQLGNGMTSNSSVPVQVIPIGSGATMVTAGDTRTCAVISGGALKCWGSNGFGQFGTLLGTIPLPVLIRAISSISLAVLPASVPFGAIATATGTVISDAGTPSGTVVVKEGYLGVGSGTVLNGQVSIPLASLAIGNHSLIASYGGDADFLPAESPPLIVTVVPNLTVYEFFAPTLNHYFRTANPDEATALDNPASGWQRTGDNFQAYYRTGYPSGASEVCRFYGSVTPGPNSHFYTGDPAECAALRALQQSTPASAPRWNFEEIAFAVDLSGTGGCPARAPVPVYRAYNNRAAQNDSNHRYTTNLSQSQLCHRYESRRAHVNSFDPPAH
ncbi:MAG: Ig-like domain repeat protein [Betaproteobacteria bacterium]|nr:Ig-like domain repeat protein [Betaproteobacteria bacterium]